MKIHSISLKNIKCFDSFETSFVPGVNFISGRNGAGKTTIVESIGLALFGAGGQSSRIQDYFLRYGEKQGEIRICFEVEQNKYTVVKRFKPGSASRHVFDAQGNELLLHGEKDVDDFITDLLHLKPNTDLPTLFNEVIGVRQGMLTQPFLSTPSQRKRLFNEMLGVERYKDAAGKMPPLQNYIKDLFTDLSTRQQINQSHTQDIDLVQSQLAEFQHLYAEKEAEYRRCLASFEELQQRLAALNAAQAQYEALEKEIARQRTQLSYELEQHEKRKAALAQTERRAQESVQQSVQNIERITKQIDALTLQHRTNAQAHEQTLAACRQTLRQEQSALDALVSKEASIRSRLSYLRDTASRVKDERCPYLNIPCTSIQGSFSEELVQRLNTGETLLQQAQSALNVKRQAVQQADRAILEEQNRMRLMENKYNQAHSQLCQERSALETGLEAHRRTLDDICREREGFPKIEAAFQAGQQQIDALVLERQTLRQTHGDPAVREQLQKQHLALNGQLHALQAQKTALTEKIDTFTNTLAQKKERLKEQKLLEEKMHHVTSVEGFAKQMRSILAGAGERIAAFYREAIGVQATQFYRDISREQAQLLWSEDYDCLLIDRHLDAERVRSFRQLSGGEQMSAALAVRLSLFLHLFGGGIVFFDEPTSNLDVQHRAGLAAMLSRVTAQFEQVFIVSHDDTFDAMSNFVIELG